jgi:hypothetical protein
MMGKGHFISSFVRHILFETNRNNLFETMVYSSRVYRKTNQINGTLFLVPESTDLGIAPLLQLPIGITWE